MRLIERLQDARTRTRRRVVDYSAYALVRLIVALVQTLPLDMGQRICGGLAMLLTGPIKIRARISRQNIDRVFASESAAARDALTVAMWRSLLLMGCEVAWAQRRLHLCNWHRHVRFRGNREMLSRLLSRRPTVMVTGHFGNFEVGGYVTGLMGISTTSIARKLDNPYLHTWVERFRQAKGQLMVDKEGCAADVDRLLQRGGTLSLLADQHAGDKGCWVNFLGAPASCHKALALFSLSSGAPMMAAYTRRLRGRPMQFESACLGIADPLADPLTLGSVDQLTRWYNARLTEAVAVAPEQYWWLHRRWRTPPEKVLRRLTARAA